LYKKKRNLEKNQKRKAKRKRSNEEDIVYEEWSPSKAPKNFSSSVQNLSGKRQVNVRKPLSPQ